MRVLHDGETLWRLEGREDPTLDCILASSEHLTVGKLHLAPGRQSDVYASGGDEFLFLIEGVLTVRVSDSASSPDQREFTLGPADGLCVPEGTLRSYANLFSRTVTAIFGAAPKCFEGEPRGHIRE